MSDRAYKRPRMYEGRHAAAGQGGPRSPEGIPTLKRPRRDFEDHPANKLPPSLRGRVTLPGDRNWEDQARPHDGRGQTDRGAERSKEQHRSSSREQHRSSSREQHNSRPRSGDRDLSQARDKQLEHGRTKDTQTPSQDPADRLRASRYDMNSSGSRGGAQAGRGHVSSSDKSDRPPSAPHGTKDRDNRPLSTGRQSSRRSSSPSRHRAGDSHSTRPAGRSDSRSEPRRRSRERDGDREQPSRHSGSSRHQQSADRRDRRDKESAGRATSSQGGDRERRQSGDQDNKAERNRSSEPDTKQPEGLKEKSSSAAAATGSKPAAVTADQSPSPSEPKPPSEEGEAAPTPKALPAVEETAAQAVDRQQQKQPSSLKPAAGESSPVDAAGDCGKAASGRSSHHQPIKFTLDKLQSVAAEDLKPKQSSKYTLPAEQQAAAPGSADKLLEKDHSKHIGREQPPGIQQSPAADPGTSGQHDKNRSAQRRDSSQGAGRDRHHETLGYRDERQQQQLQHRSREHHARQQDVHSRDRRRSCDPSQDATSKRPKTDGSGLDGAAVSYRATTGSAHTTLVKEEYPVQAATPNSTQAAARLSKEQVELPQQQRSTLGSVVLGAPLSKFDVGRDGTDLLAPPAVMMCVEGQAKTAALRARQAGQVAVQLQGLPISQQLCYKEVWEEVCQVGDIHPKDLDGDSAALQHMAAAAAAASSQYCGHLLTPVQPMRSATIRAGSEEAHIKHLQALIDSFTEVSAAPYCVQLLDGGSVLLPAELQGVLW